MALPLPAYSQTVFVRLTPLAAPCSTALSPCPHMVSRPLPLPPVLHPQSLPLSNCVAPCLAASVDALREDVTASSWFAEFQRDLRGSVLRALQVCDHSL